ncbi:13569_t:CDS:1 [Cetraspora pellucida]|uniref:13569_t:CDS:1 n=1 Tax=Cetraspora pellucida TaxID=1433469 RepID=A0A9N9FWF6_9GLOM|nr:13569_t:CDS:1 [Cetraspora pellucida]
METQDSITTTNNQNTVQSYDETTQYPIKTQVTVEQNYNVLENLIKKVGDLELSVWEEKTRRIKLEKKIKKIKKKNAKDNKKKEKYNSQLLALDKEEKSAIEFVEFYKTTWLDGVEKAIARGNSVFPVIGGAVGGLIAVGVGYSKIDKISGMYEMEKHEKLLQKTYQK